MSGGTGVGSVSSAWQPLGTGDFNGDGTADVLWRNSNTGEVDTWLMNDGQIIGGSAIGSVSSAWQFAGTGDFNGDGTSDVLWHNTTTGEVDTWLMSNGHIIGGDRDRHRCRAPGRRRHRRLQRRRHRPTFCGATAATGEVDIWLIVNGQMTGGTAWAMVSSAWQLVGTGDFNGNGTNDCCGATRRPARSTPG